MESDIDENDKQSKKYDEENKSKFDYYFIICFTTILGYFLKSIINIILINYKDYSQFFYYAIGLYCLLIIISLFFKKYNLSNMWIFNIYSKDVQ